jgi:hypothetical protein
MDLPFKKTIGRTPQWISADDVEISSIVRQNLLDPRWGKWLKEVAINA